MACEKEGNRRRTTMYGYSPHTFIIQRLDKQSKMSMRSHLAKWVFHLHSNRLGGQFCSVCYIVAVYSDHALPVFVY